MIDDTWLKTRLAGLPERADDTEAVRRLRTLLQQHAIEFAELRTDVLSAEVAWPRRGLHHDEASGFLRAVDSGLAAISPGGYVALPTVRQKAPAGRYALFSKSGQGVSINLEYLVQIAATAELVLDHGWPPQEVDFERGEFDALAHDPTGRVVVAMEAKARATGPDSLDTMVRSWLGQLRDPSRDRRNNAGRKLDELIRLCQQGSVVVWLVADDARWTLTAHSVGRTIDLEAADGPLNSVLKEKASVIESQPYDASYHRAGSVAAEGLCSWHGRACPETPIVSFKDEHGDRQSGCARAVRELVDRGLMRAPT